jgi:hypothetical protein
VGREDTLRDPDAKKCFCECADDGMMGMAFPAEAEDESAGVAAASSEAAAAVAAVAAFFPVAADVESLGLDFRVRLREGLGPAGSATEDVFDDAPEFFLGAAGNFPTSSSSADDAPPEDWFLSDRRRRSADGPPDARSSGPTLLRLSELGLLFEPLAVLAASDGGGGGMVWYARGRSWTGRASYSLAFLEFMRACKEPTPGNEGIWNLGPGIKLEGRDDEQEEAEAARKDGGMSKGKQLGMEEDMTIDGGSSSFGRDGRS